MKSQRPEVVLVLGMHRSGTSSVAELIAHAGYAVPGDHLPFAEEVNARGFWESQQVVDFNEGLLSAAGMSWFALQSAAVDISEEHYCSMLEWLKEQLLTKPNLVIKDPRINILLPIWCRLLDDLDANIKIVFVNRYPDFVAASLEKRDGFSLHTGFALWLKYNWEALSILVGREIAFVDFEDLVESDTCKAFLLESLGKSYSVDEFDLIIDAGLVRNKKNLLEVSTEISSMARDLHSVISANSRSVKVIDFSAVASTISNRVAQYYLENRSVLECLDDANKKLVYARKKMIENGRLYSEALSVINEKDKALNDNSNYIASCHAQISMLQQKIESHVVNTDDVIDVIPLYEQALVSLKESIGRENQTSEYIELCHARIAELYGSLRQASERADKLAVTLMDQERLLRVNSSLKSDLEKCRDDSRSLSESLSSISEKHNAAVSSLLAKDAEIELLNKGHIENTDYIDRCHNQIALLNDAISEKEKNESDARVYIDSCHVQLSVNEDQIKSLLQKVDFLSDDLAKEKLRASKVLALSNKMEGDLAELSRRCDCQAESLNAAENMCSLLSQELHKSNYKLNAIYKFVDEQEKITSVSQLNDEFLCDSDNYKLAELARQRIHARQLVNTLLEQQVDNLAMIESLNHQVVVLSNDPIAGILNKKIISRMNHCD